MTDAVMAGALQTNPVREIAARRTKKADKKRVKGAPVLDDGQVDMLLKAIDESELCARKDLRDPVILLAGTGL